MSHILEREQQLNCDISSAWKFFSSPYNLAELTPKDMGFVVTTKLLPENIYEGMVIDYLVSPIMGIPLKWQTKITQVDFQKSFTDFQQKGPYKLWNHQHTFIPNKEGVLMIDRVEYELPFGPLGTIAHKLFVKKKLANIFNYRYETLEKLINQKTDTL